MPIEIVQRVLAGFKRVLGRFVPRFTLHVGYVPASFGVGGHSSKINRLKSIPFFAWQTDPSIFGSHLRNRKGIMVRGGILAPEALASSVGQWRGLLTLRRFHERL